MDAKHTTMNEIRLQSDIGGELVFNGRIFSECSWDDEEYGVQMRQKLYVADNNDQIYYIVRSGKEKSRQAYRLSFADGMCTINNGAQSLTLTGDMLRIAVRALCGLNAGAAASVEETLAAASI